MLTNLSIVARTGIKSTKLPSKLNFIVICRVRTNSVEVRFSDDLLVLGLCSKSGDLINRRYRCIYIYISDREVGTDGNADIILLRLQISRGRIPEAEDSRETSSWRETDAAGGHLHKSARNSSRTGTITYLSWRGVYVRMCDGRGRVHIFGTVVGSVRLRAL